MPIIKYYGGREGEYLEYLASFADGYKSLPHVKASLESAALNLAQAKLLVGEPIGLFACLTAEEEAAAFLYHCLKSKGYRLPNFGKFRDHGDKARMMIWALIMEEYFLRHFESFGENAFLEVHNNDGRVLIKNFLIIGKYAINMVSLLQMVASKDGIPDGPKHMMDACVQRALDRIGQSASIVKTIDKMKNRRNLCLYGATANKPRLKDIEQWNIYKTRSEMIITLGFLVLQDEEISNVLQDLCDTAAQATSNQQSR